MSQVLHILLANIPNQYIHHNAHHQRDTLVPKYAFHQFIQNHQWYQFHQFQNILFHAKEVDS